MVKFQEYEKLNDADDADSIKWDIAKENAEIIFQRTYLSKVLYIHNILQKHMCDWKVRMMNIPVKLEITVLTDMDIPENDCSELTEKTAHAIDDTTSLEPITFKSL
jgi:hypothetical protein